MALSSHQHLVEAIRKTASAMAYPLVFEQNYSNAKNLGEQADEYKRLRSKFEAVLWKVAADEQERLLNERAACLADAIEGKRRG